jgi:DHA2 family multidrug resistance protein
LVLFFKKELLAYFRLEHRMADDLPYSAAGGRSPWLIAVIVSIATFMEVLDTTVANVSLHHIAGSLGAGQDESTYVITSYLVANAIILPVSGWLANMLGRKRFYMICVGLFSVASLLCATATSLWQILFWRVMQGLGGGGLAPVEQSIFADSFPARQRPQAFALYGLTVVCAPAIGPVLGGWLTDTLSWHWVFLINVPVGMISLVLTWLFVVDSPALIENRRKLLAKGLNIDFVGFLLVALGFGTLQIVLDRFERAGGWGTPFVNLWGTISIVSLIVLVVWEWKHKNPAVNLQLFRIPSFAITNVQLFALGFILMASSQLLPQMAQEVMGYDALTSGLTLGVAGLLTIGLMPVSGIVTGRFVQPKYLVVMAFAGTAVSMWVASSITLQAGFWDLSHIRMLQAMWLPFLFIPLMSLSVAKIPPQASNDASALNNLTRNIGGSFGISFCTTLLAYRGQFHHARLAEHITPYNGYGPGMSLLSIGHRIQTQATVMSYIDVFAMMAALSVFAMLLAFFLPRLPKGAVAAH